MRYRLIPPEGSANPITVFVVPVSGDPLDYLILYPRLRGSVLVGALARGQGALRAFSGVTPEAMERVSEHLGEAVRREEKRTEGRTTSMVFSGIAIAALGLANWFVPDPLPAVDELVLTLGGAALALFGRRRKNREELIWADRAEAARATIRSLRAGEDGVLSRAFGSLRALENRDPHRDGRDAIENESRWLVDYVDALAAVQEGSATEEEIRELFRVLSRFIPFRTLRRLEGRGGAAIRRKRRILARLRDRHGLTANAVTVYCEFYRSAREAWGDVGR